LSKIHTGFPPERTALDRAAAGSKASLLSSNLLRPVFARTF
jgi:hypothetical protein